MEQVNGIPKYSEEDTTLAVTNAAGDKCMVPIPKGSPIVLNTVALHYNRVYLATPHSYATLTLTSQRDTGQSLKSFDLNVSWHQIGPGMPSFRLVLVRTSFCRPETMILTNYAGPRACIGRK